MTWTWTRAGPREWRVSIDTRPKWQRDAEEVARMMRQIERIVLVVVPNAP